MAERIDKPLMDKPARKAVLPLRSTYRADVRSTMVDPQLNIGAIHAPGSGEKRR